MGALRQMESGICFLGGVEGIATQLAHALQELSRVLPRLAPPHLRSVSSPQKRAIVRCEP